MAQLTSAADLENFRKVILAQRDPNKPCVTLCSGTGCHAYGCEKIALTFEEEIKKQGLAGKVDFRRTGCHGFCEKGPLVIIYPEEVCYTRVKPEDSTKIISETLVQKK